MNCSKRSDSTKNLAADDHHQDPERITKAEGGTDNAGLDVYRF